MTIYRVDLVQTVIEETTIYIEANNKEDAAEQAIDRALTGEDVKWSFADCKDDRPEILAVEPVKRSEKWAEGVEVRP